MASTTALDRALIETWETNQRVTRFLVGRLPPAIWATAVPGAPRRTIRMIAGHMHNSRCMWIKALAGGRFRAPAAVDRHRVTCGQSLNALEHSGVGIGRLLTLGLESGGAVPRPANGWVNFPLDVPHVLAYFVAHEAHHRGQIILAARQLGHRLPVDVTAGVWQWKRRRTDGSPRRGKV